jgi:hypothetical protein
MLVSWVEMPRSPGHAFYDKLQGVLIAAGFDRFVEASVPWTMRHALAVHRCRRDATSVCLLIGSFDLVRLGKAFMTRDS